MWRCGGHPLQQQLDPAYLRPQTGHVPLQPLEAIVGIKAADERSIHSSPSALVALGRSRRREGRLFQPAKLTIHAARCSTMHSGVHLNLSLLPLGQAGGGGIGIDLEGGCGEMGEVW